MSALAPTRADLPPHLAVHIVDQAWETMGPAEHRLWRRLYDTQHGLLRDRACAAFLRGLDALDLSGGAPDFVRINQRLEGLTGWRIVPVAGLVPDAVFFELLSRRRFPAARFLRAESEVDYLAEPDIFHDVFGHVPLLTDPVFADYMQAYGAGGLRAQGLDHLDHLARLYWHTVEFGLVREAGSLRIYGAGIVSSRAETLFALESPAPRRIAFDMQRVMRTRYRIDDLQETYFVIPSLEALLEATLRDFGGLYAALAGSTDIAPGAVVDGDELIAAAAQ